MRDACDAEVEEKENGKAPAEEADVSSQSEREANESDERERDHEPSRGVQHLCPFPR